MAFHVLVGGLALEQACGAGEEAQVVDDDRDLVDRRPDRLAGVLRLEPADLVHPGLERVGELEEHVAAVRRRGLLPRLEGGRGGLDRPVDVLLAAGRDLGDGLARGRVLDGQCLAGGGVDPLPADELLVRLDLVDDGGHWGLLSCRRR